MLGSLESAVRLPLAALGCLVGVAVCLRGKRPFYFWSVEEQGLFISIPPPRLPFAFAMRHGFC